MWLASSPTTDIVQNLASSPYTLATAAIASVTTLVAIPLRAHFSRPEKKAVEPVAKQSAKDAAAEIKDLLMENVVAPLQDELERERAERVRAARELEREQQARRRAETLADAKLRENERLIGENAVLRRQLEQRGGHE